MNRQKSTTLAGTMTVAQAYTAVLRSVGLFMLYSINVLSAFFGGRLPICRDLHTVKKNFFSALVGAFPGAIPYMLGW